MEYINKTDYYSGSMASNKDMTLKALERSIAGTGNEQMGFNSRAKKKETAGHKIVLSGRTMGIITGVTDIEEFDNNTIDMTTSLGRLIIKGRDLKVKGLNLETGEAEIEGNVDSMVYTSKQNSESLLKRLFK